MSDVLTLSLRENVTSGPEEFSLRSDSMSASRRRVPFFIARQQLYYWTPSWQAGEAEALQDIAEGRFQTFDTGSAASKWLLDDEG
jgi:hypothetical protein